ncbi:hypothetical protein NGM10_16055 (plasmid) [Halorussus salilacus]|uniref:hypothetical protein n=1 Tax=Halorussus salilacus TaxID=2953750 RepID=UPI00209E1E11|nr:hypothetical protein [Halorussus salilacus]USZ69916.1 hypothetical protein NGM10_16055 [Halorussus salilacus]
MSDRRGRRAERPGRQIEAAESRRRRSWDGNSLGAVSEKDPLGLLLDDAAYVFADVSVFSIPILYTVMMTSPARWYGTKTSALVAWAAMVGVGTLIRGGWVRPLGTDVRGWVSLTPWLVLFRVVYFNAALAAAAYGGEAAVQLGSPAGSLATGAVVGAVSVGVFPRLAESFYLRVSG